MLKKIMNKMKCKKACDCCECEAECGCEADCGCEEACEEPCDPCACGYKRGLIERLVTRCPKCDDCGCDCGCTPCEVDCGCDCGCDPCCKKECFLKKLFKKKCDPCCMPDCGCESTCTSCGCGS
ncbi:hypothetical protein [Planctomycetes bacterium Pan216]|uniref:hypothetical protein n=1 Tax=Kolteria novifilia TaxID=2527975 RepID=UPI00119E23BE